MQHDTLNISLHSETYAELMMMMMMMMMKGHDIYVCLVKS